MGLTAGRTFSENNFEKGKCAYSRSNPAACEYVFSTSPASNQFPSSSSASSLILYYFRPHPQPLWSHCRFVVFAESISGENPHKYVCRESGSSENPTTFSFSGDLKCAVAPEFLSVWLEDKCNKSYKANRRCVASLFQGFRKMPARFFGSCLSVFMSYFPTLWPLARRNNLNQFGLSNPDTPRAKPRSPCSKQPTALTACITARWC